MKKDFTCTNISKNTFNQLYITDKQQLEKIEDTNIRLRCYVDDFLIAITELGKIKDKSINYLVRIRENLILDNYDNLFDVFKELVQYKNNIFGLELTLSSKVKEDDFKKLTQFLQCITLKFDLKLNLGSMKVFNEKQLNTLKNINKNLNIKLNINQFYQGKYRDNNMCDNSYIIDDLISIKEKINEIINKIPSGYNDLEKILFLYKYLGKKVKYSDKISGLKDEKRKSHDLKSIYDVLFNSKGVCSSIAATFRVLMEAIDIECQVVSSLSHEWNVVKIDEIWYHLDLTWDLYNIKHNYPLSYFLKSERYIQKDKDHKIIYYYAEKEEIASRSIPIRLYKKL